MAAIARLFWPAATLHDLIDFSDRYLYLTNTDCTALNPVRVQGAVELPNLGLESVNILGVRVVVDRRDILPI